MMRVLPVLVLLLIQSTPPKTVPIPAVISGKSKFLVVNSKEPDNVNWYWYLGIDYRYVSRILWPKMLEITGVNPNLRIPATSLDDQKPMDRRSAVLGRYYAEKKEIRIYYLNIYDSVFFRSHASGNINHVECEAQLYLTIAHELLHYILDAHGVPPEDHHLVMRDKGFGAEVSRYITLQLHSKGWAYANETSYLRIESDRRRIELSGI